MKSWERARLDETCGRCNRKVKPTDPVLVFTMPQLSAAARRRIRCQECAGEAPDQAQLDAFDEGQERAALASDGSQQIYVFPGVTKTLPFDAKAAAAGKDGDA